jgi:phosphoribosylformimino-5-aminoimidazole carboxamide ribotide isomerase
MLASKVINEFRPDKIIASLDCKNLKVKTHGWVNSSNHDIFTAIESMIKIGYNWFTVTDISKDGMLQGPTIDLYKNILERFPYIKLRASGGVSSFKDIDDLGKLNLEGAIVGKMLYEKNVDGNI